MSIVSQLQAGIDSNVAALVAGARYVHELWGNLFAEYRGDIPLGLALVRCWHETNGKPRAESSQGEKGLLQLFDADSKALGVDDPFDPEQNVWGGLLMWNRRSRSLVAELPAAFPVPDENFWGCSNLTMSIGRGGTVALCKRVGGGLSDIVEYVKTNPSAFQKQVDSWYAGKTFRQSAELVANRIGDTVTWMQAAKHFGPILTTGYGSEPSRTFAKVLPVALIGYVGLK